MSDLTIVSWDGNNINDGSNYRAGFRPGRAWGLPGVRPRQVRRTGGWPVISGVERPGRTLVMLVTILDTANLRTRRDELLRWFDPEDEESKQLIIEDADGSDDRYVYAICEEFQPLVIRGVASSTTFVVVLSIDGDVRWRSTSETSDSWSITATGDTHTITNGGTDDAYPTFEITPTSTKTGGYAYREFWSVTWRSDNAGLRYPIRLGPIDTAALVTAGKMQADGDDLRVFVDGVEVDRWLVDINTASTYVWINADFQPQQSGSLKTAIASSGTISSIEFDDDDDISGFPAAGLVRIDDELFAYTNKSDADRELTGVTRAAKGTSAAAHTAGDTISWIQREIQVVYGNPSVSAPDVDDDYKPMFSLANSSNIQWHYTQFGDGNGKRAARWRRWGNITVDGRGGVYTATQRTLADPYTVAGAWLDELHGNAYGWYLENPCGIINAAWADGYKRAETKEDFLIHLMYWVRGASWWTWQATLADPSADDTWESWSEAAAASDWDEADTLAIGAYFYPQDVEVGTVTVDLSASETPSTLACGEQGNYRLDATITNNATGEAITVAFDMDLNETLVINTDDETVEYDADGTRQSQAVETVGGVREHWLKLQPGSNELQFDDTGTAAVTFVTKFEERSY